jgi:hypothetical protein
MAREGMYPRLHVERLMLISMSIAHGDGGDRMHRAGDDRSADGVDVLRLFNVR